MTVDELQRILMKADDGDAEVKIVYHGHHAPSFTLPVKEAKQGPALNGTFLIVTEEPRT